MHTKGDSRQGGYVAGSLSANQYKAEKSEDQMMVTVTPCFFNCKHQTTSPKDVSLARFSVLLVLLTGKGLCVLWQ